MCVSCIVQPDLGSPNQQQHPYFRPLMLGSKDWMDIFAPFGNILREGDVIQRTNLSRTLSIIAEEGPDAIVIGIGKVIEDRIFDHIKAV